MLLALAFLPADFFFQKSMVTIHIGHSVPHDADFSHVVGHLGHQKLRICLYLAYECVQLADQDVFAISLVVFLV